jgi:hypothetical protein
MSHVHIGIFDSQLYLFLESVKLATNIEPCSDYINGSQVSTIPNTTGAKIGQPLENEKTLLPREVIYKGREVSSS